MDEEVVGGLEVGGGGEEVLGGRFGRGWGAGGTLTATGRPDSTASWSVVFLGLEWKSFKFFKGLLVVTACRERRSDEGGREYERKVSTLRFAELEISFLISGFATSSSSSSCKPPCRKLNRVSGIRATSPGCDLKKTC